MENNSVMDLGQNGSLVPRNCNGSLCSGNVTRTTNAALSTFLTAEFNVTLYCLIFLLSVSGNALVLITLFREKKMRTVTNVFLLNLAISDLMLSVLCMPFTLVATIILRDFIFGEVMCVIIRYFQAVSVGVSCYTLVAISLERYYAICQPFRSRRWQTLSHARRMLVGIWLLVLVVMSPIAAFHRLIVIRTGANACREIWPPILIQYRIDLAYSIFLAVFLLLVPLILMTTYYSLVSKKLWISYKTCNTADVTSMSRSETHSNGDSSKTLIPDVTRHLRDQGNRKRVIRMLVVIVLQYFICWTPTYLLNTWQAVDFRTVLYYISPTVKSLLLLLAYTSSFIHPITYCFMNKSFKSGFARSFRGCTPKSSQKEIALGRTSLTCN